MAKLVNISDVAQAITLTFDQADTDILGVFPKTWMFTSRVTQDRFLSRIMFTDLDNIYTKFDGNINQAKIALSELNVIVANTTQSITKITIS